MRRSWPRRRPSVAPHKRGSPQFEPCSGVVATGYPAQAGVYLSDHTPRIPYSCLPRTSGDLPALHFVVTPLTTFTPHKRGSTQKPALDSIFVRSCPAPAGIHLYCPVCPRHYEGVPRESGGLPTPGGSITHPSKSALHQRGSTFQTLWVISQQFVFPAPAGVYHGEDQTEGNDEPLPRNSGGLPEKCE